MGMRLSGEGYVVYWDDGVVIWWGSEMLVWVVKDTISVVNCVFGLFKK
jgi:hypothetical protein